MGAAQVGEGAWASPLKGGPEGPGVRPQATGVQVPRVGVKWSVGRALPMRPHPEGPRGHHWTLTADGPQVQALHSLHENGALVPLGDALYVTGGRWQGMDGDYHVEMEAYDPGRDAWIRHGALPRLWLYHGASAVFLDVSKWTQPFGPAQEP